MLIYFIFLKYKNNNIQILQSQKSIKKRNLKNDFRHVTKIWF